MTGDETTQQPSIVDEEGSGPGTSTPEPGDTAPAGARPTRNRVTVALAAAVAVLVVFGAVMTALYVNAGSRLDRTLLDRNNAIAAGTAELDQVRASNADLQAALKTARDRQIDPQGVELIKSCVQQGAQREQQIRAAIENLQRGEGGAVTVVAIAPRDGADYAPIDLTTCTKATGYLK